MKYPQGQRQIDKKITTYNNRGMSLEDDINVSNEYYLTNDIAIIHKKPIPLQIRNVDFKSRKDAVIKEAYFKVKSTTDYNGIYKGKHLDFEAKETKSKTAFPLSNIHTHQMKHMEQIYNHGGISFVVIKFVIYDEYYLLPIETIISFLKAETRKSIPYSFFKENVPNIKVKYNPRLDYLNVIDELYFKGGHYGK